MTSQLHRDHTGLSALPFVSSFQIVSLIISIVYFLQKWLTRWRNDASVLNLDGNGFIRTNAISIVVWMGQTSQVISAGRTCGRVVSSHPVNSTRFKLRLVFYGRFPRNCIISVATTGKNTRHGQLVAAKEDDPNLTTGWLSLNHGSQTTIPRS